VVLLATFLDLAHEFAGAGKLRLLALASDAVVPHLGEGVLRERPGAAGRELVARRERPQVLQHLALPLQANEVVQGLDTLPIDLAAPRGGEPHSLAGVGRAQHGPRGEQGHVPVALHLHRELLDGHLRLGLLPLGLIDPDGFERPAEVELDRAAAPSHIDINDAV
jgi:hypothetical protein